MCERHPPIVVQSFHNQLQRERDTSTFLDSLTAPTPAQQWLEQASAKLREEGEA